jgi:quinol monooxygenase YgiN
VKSGESENEMSKRREITMWVRLIEVKIQTDKMDELRKIYYEEIVPVVKAQNGNIDIFLMESVDREGEAISFTSWESKADGDAYEETKTYVKMVDKVKHTFVDAPTLWSYEVNK